MNYDLDQIELSKKQQKINLMIIYVIYSFINEGEWDEGGKRDRNGKEEGAADDDDSDYAAAAEDN